MYNVKGPSKIVAKTTRRGIPQNMDNMRDYTRHRSVENEETETTSCRVSKPVFHNKKSTPHHHHPRQETITPQHEEIIKYINESWNSVCSEVYQDLNNSPNSSKDHSIFYEEESTMFLENFKPFDLESWWGKRLYTHLTGSTNGKN